MLNVVSLTRAYTETLSIIIIIMNISIGIIGVSSFLTLGNYVSIFDKRA